MLNLLHTKVSIDHNWINLSGLAERTQIGLLEENPIDLEIAQPIAVAGIAPARYTLINSFLGG